MPIEIRLKALLQEYGRDTQGVIKKMAAEIGVHRHSIGHLYRNEAKNPSLELLDSACDWLIQNGVPRSDLPHRLFAFRPMEFWEAIAASGHVTFYLGEYLQETGSPGYQQRWVSRWDSDAVDGIVRHLTVPGNARAAQPHLSTVYATFRAGTTKRHSPGTEEFTADVASAKRLFTDMRAQSRFETPIIVGSQRVNYVLEHFVADLFQCDPFTPCAVGRVPFYLKYRPEDRLVESCAGGRGGPGSPNAPGVYYLNKKGQWVLCPWKPREQDAGVVIVTRDPGTGALEIALFGFSGWATGVLGHQLHHWAKMFWPLAARTPHKEVGVFICPITFRSKSEKKPDGTPPNDVRRGLPQVATFDVIPLDKSILESRLA